ncbi:septation ring formation regulator EzrA [Niallia sp. FSL W8-0635]|uniref:septation ring formation regulator EzrA n=1 Tax=Niallia sp. FSL W8-0635 TaxID=2975337 RepID=UPI0009C719A4|nr:Septation ring formation regulator EzrA [Mycobacteroides abscessus subsp. abscessus]HEO8420043.1 septation ring formation regulator EzrA [Yersinia enterocolitica]
MNYIIGGIGLVICLFVAGYFIKRKYYNGVDELENWKINIMNRPVLEELAKVKQLNMIGQTEELFERWRKEWDDIVVSELPEIEELLFDTESYIDKYNFPKAKKTQETIHMKMESVDKRIDTILEELNNLVGSEEKNRTEMEELKESYRVSKKNLLAHRHTFGDTEKKIEMMLTEIAELLITYDEKTNNGDYLEAREIVYKIQDRLTTITYLLEKIPPLLIECQTKLPEQLDELKDGYIDMLEQGYILEHLQMEEEIEKLTNELASTENDLKEGNVEAVEKVISEIQEKLDLLYDLLEKEVIAKNYCNNNINVTKEILADVQQGNAQLQVEVGLLRNNYNLDNEDIELQFKLEKKLNHLYKQYEVLEHKLLTESVAHTLLGEELKELKGQLENASIEQKALFEKLHDLRKDEVSAHNRIRELSKQVTDAVRRVTNSNLPGVTDEYNELVQEAKESIDEAKIMLERTPLNMVEVKKRIDVTEEKVTVLVNATIELVETVYLAEKIIQYGNRYRRHYQAVNQGLLEAEAHFRNYRYKEALQCAAATIEEIEPGSSNKMEAWSHEWKENENSNP